MGNLLIAITLACVGIAAAEPGYGYYGGYRGYGGYGYGGYRHYGKRSADAEPTAVADADAEPGYYGGYYGGYRGYGGYGYGGYRHYGKRSADADAEPGSMVATMVDTAVMEDTAMEATDTTARDLLML